MSKALFAHFSLLTACALAWTGCTVKSTEAPPLAGPSEYALSFNVSANPDALSQDGGSQAAIVVRAFGPDGKPKQGVSFRLDVFVGSTAVDYGSLSAKNVVTGADGKATAMYTSPAPLPEGANIPTCSGLPGNCVDVYATPSGSDFSGSHTESVRLRLMPLGVILPPALTPTASFIFSPAAPTANMAVQFDASASCSGPSSNCNSGGAITNFEWQFGDGSGGNGRLSSHAYAYAGTYNATLTVTNDRGVKASTTKAISVGTGAAPTAAFVYSPKPVAFGAQAFFDGSNSRPGAGHRIASYAWNWGDNEQSPTSASPLQQHDYQISSCTPAEGKCRFTVVLTVTDETGQIGTTTQDVEVGGAP